MTPSLQSQLTERLGAVRQRIAEACRRVGRSPDEVTLVAVTKTAPTETAALLPALGVFDLGENRPQELWRKSAVLPEGVRWHLIGHLQRNKIKRTLPLVSWIHSVDSLRLLTALEQEAEKLLCTFPVLLEVNVSREATKHGFAPEELLALLPEILQLQFIRVRGLMTMAAPENDPERCRPTFAALRELRDYLVGESVQQLKLEHLSMGMSNDFEVAIEEGATLVRIGSAIFDLESR